MKDCRGYLEGGFCCKDLDSGRVWDCTCEDINVRQTMSDLPWHESCPYPRLNTTSEELKIDISAFHKL